MDYEHDGWNRYGGAGHNPILDRHWDWCKREGFPFIKVQAQRKYGYAVIDFLPCGWVPSPTLASKIRRAMLSPYTDTLIREHSPSMLIPDACDIAEYLAKLVSSVPAEDRWTEGGWKGQALATPGALGRGAAKGRSRSQCPR